MAETTYESLTSHLPSALPGAFLIEPDAFLDLLADSEDRLVIHTTVTTLSLKGIQAANMYTMRHEGFIFRTGTKEEMDFPAHVRLVQVKETA